MFQGGEGVFCEHTAFSCLYLAGNPLYTSSSQVHILPFQHVLLLESVAGAKFLKKLKRLLPRELSQWLQSRYIHCDEIRVGALRIALRRGRAATEKRREEMAGVLT